MTTIRYYWWLVVFCLGCCPSYADPLSQKSEVGQIYPLVREKLIKAGDSPIAQGNLQYNCDMVEDLCLLYPEEMDCAIGAIGQAVTCGFEWKSKVGERYSIVTVGEDPQKLLIQEISPTPRSLIEKRLVK